MPRFSGYSILAKALVPIVTSLTATSSVMAQDRPISAVMRGFGKVEYSSQTAKTGTPVARFVCESEAAAKLLLSKYISDLGVLPGKKEITLGRFTVSQIENQGLICAVREGKQVRVFSAPSVAELQKQLAAQNISPSAVSKPEVEVPMWLDRWDKYGFRFYNYAWETPGGQSLASYDFRQDFDFAQKNKAGMIFWNELFMPDTGDGLMNYGYFDWIAKASREKKLPAGLNLQAVEPSWLVNRWRDQSTLKMPQYIGGFHQIGSGYLGGMGWLSWSAREGKDEVLGLLQQSVKKYTKDPNITTILEPHGEMAHGPQDRFLEYGPSIDIALRDFLRKKYKTLSEVNKHWGEKFTSWDQVRLPELAHFTGWNNQALDLTGTWRVGYEPLKGITEAQVNNYYRDAVPTEGAPSNWFDADFDDSSWPQAEMPGDDKAMFLPHRPAVLRRHFEVSPQLRANGKRLWVYIWSLNYAKGDFASATLNGKKIGETKTERNVPQWNAWEITDSLKDGNNVLAVRVPKGYLGYRTYISAVPPRQYPDLGPQLNAQWSDWMALQTQIRHDTVKSSLEMIRQVDQNRNIVFMSPSDYVDTITDLAQEYGGEMHNTGSTAAFIHDEQMMVSRASGLAYSVEPGGPAADLPDFKRFFGLYNVQGIQGVDYFIHIGNVMWNPEIRAYFEKNLQRLQLFGKYHAPRAQVATLFSSRSTNLTDYPWGKSDNFYLAGGYWYANTSANLFGYVEHDGLTEPDFHSKNGAVTDASKYKIVFDSNTSIWNDEIRQGIERYVRDGGTFVTYGQTGRNTESQKDAWPISELSGFRVTKIDRHDEHGEAIDWSTIKPAPNQKIFDSSFDGIRANGLHMEKVASDAQPLLLWEDGSIAAGIRKLGKGQIIHLGAKFTGAILPDHLDGPPDEKFLQLTKTLLAITKSYGIAGVAAKLEAPSNVIWRHYESNNGLYDIWVLWNSDGKNAAKASLNLDAARLWPKGKAPKTALEISGAGKEVPLQKAKLKDIEIEPYESRIFITPRLSLNQAPSAWFDIQRQWWRAARKPGSKVLPVPVDGKHSLDLSEGWKETKLTGTQDGAKIVEAGLQSKTGGNSRLTVEMGENQRRTSLWTRSFTVPAQWNNGKVALWVRSWSGPTFLDRGRVFLDGREIKGWGDGGVEGYSTPDLAPNTTHTIAIEMQSEGYVTGMRGNAWLSFAPAPIQSIDLSGSWEISKDGFNYAQATLPGAWDGLMARREVTIPARKKDERLWIHIEDNARIVGAIVNGRWVRRHHHIFGGTTRLDITPLVRFGATNRIEIVAWEGPTQGKVDGVTLEIHAPDPATINIPKK